MGRGHNSASDRCYTGLHIKVSLFWTQEAGNDGQLRKDYKQWNGEAPIKKFLDQIPTRTKRTENTKWLHSTERVCGNHHWSRNQKQGRTACPALRRPMTPVSTRHGQSYAVVQTLTTEAPIHIRKPTRAWLEHDIQTTLFYMYTVPTCIKLPVSY
jgi:hypothetical protein